MVTSKVPEHPPVTPLGQASTSDTTMPNPDSDNDPIYDCSASQDKKSLHKAPTTLSAANNGRKRQLPQKKWTMSQVYPTISSHFYLEKQHTTNTLQDQSCYKAASPSLSIQSSAWRTSKTTEMASDSEPP
ncbi:hypothetical protein AV530_018244 [Patagioenas fasciata monilis]|uniref:Uncharacterized protein n=1 Tax=Patagioenas fasciata monilis TaxID=372326 RepID=A0A1V4JRG1_PATFA|nr:hypothetical protein AV530_018244 [Patagioenas fasciata monilis]